MCMRQGSGQNYVLLHSIRKGHLRANCEDSQTCRCAALLLPARKYLAKTPYFRYQGSYVVEYAKTRHDASVSGRHHPRMRTAPGMDCLAPLSPAERGALIGSV